MKMKNRFSTTMISSLFLLLISFVLTSCNCFENVVSCENPSRNLYPICVNGKYGYVSEKGKIIVKPQYDDANYFRQGLARVSRKEKYGYIDQSGKLIIDIKYRNAHDFSEGLALVKVGEKYGYIDKKGNIKIKPQYEVGYDFSEGVAGVMLPEDKYYSYIDKNGKIVIKTKYAFVGNFHNGYAYAEIPFGKSFKYGYINKYGELKIQHPNSMRVYKEDQLPVTNFSEGFAIMTIISNAKTKKVFINTQGNVLGSREFDEAEIFSEGYAAVRYDGQSGYIDTTGQIVIKGQFTAEGNFSEGLSAVLSLKNGKIGFINKNGNIVIKPKFDKILTPFCNGVAEVEYLEKSCYIDNTGKIIWYPENSEFEESL